MHQSNAEGRDYPAQPALTDDLRLLLVEDDEEYASLVKAMVEGFTAVRFCYEHSNTLRAATERLTSGPYHVILLDLGLPDAHDLEALSSLVELAGDLPIVILSGADNEALAVEAVKAGAQDYLIKSQATSDVLERSIRYAIERKHSELQVRHLAYRDSLTQLPNRLLLMEHLEAALKRARRDGYVAGVFFVDIDHFKQINDSFGHHAGDDVLRQVATRLRNALRDNDTLARLGGDEFVALVEVKQRRNLAIIAETLHRSLKSPFTAAGGELFLTASIGVSSYPADGDESTQLLRNADRAMYRAKAEGRDAHRFYEDNPEPGLSTRLAFSSGLRRAVERDELLLHFQPLIDLRTGAIDGVEALVRWRHPTMGLIPPADFIPIAEESGLILSIERWVMESAMSEMIKYRNSGSLKLAINLSTRHFDHPELLEELTAISGQVGYDTRFLELELTERGLMHYPKRVLGHLKEFRRLGICVAVDDFGTGYSCLGLMKQYPLSALKIDRSFVRNCARDETDQALVAAIIRMGHALGLSVTAEGVETAAQADYLRQQRCDRAQGSYFSRPLPRGQLSRLLGRTTTVARRPRKAATV